MRVFIAIEIPDEIYLEFKKIQEQLIQENKNGIKPVNSFHLTLKFLGEVDESQLSEIKSNLEKIKFEPFEATLDKIGVFPNMNHINVIWVGLQPELNIENIAKAIDPENKKFKPHVTLARVKFLNDKAALVEKINNISVPKLSFEVNNLKLIKSTLTIEGPIYETIEEYSQSNQ